MALRIIGGPPGGELADEPPQQAHETDFLIRRWRFCRRAMHIEKSKCLPCAFEVRIRLLCTQGSQRLCILAHSRQQVRWLEFRAWGSGLAESPRDEFFG